MHLHWRQKPSAASIVTLATVLATLTLMGCAEWAEMLRHDEAGAMMKAGRPMLALAALLPPPANLIVPAAVLIGGHIASTCLRRGPRPPTEPKPKGLGKKPTLRVDLPHP